MSIEAEEFVIQDLPQIGDWVRWGASQFEGAGLYFGHGTDNAWDEAVELVLWALNMQPEVDARVFECNLTQQERSKLYSLIQRRIDKRLPLPYLTHRAWFVGLSFYVDSRVLIPRSPLGEWIQKEFQPWLLDSPGKILDLCTGSGCLAIASAYVFPVAEIDAVDFSEDALAVAEINRQQHGLESQIHLIHSDLFNSLEGKTYDLIISNPPYVSEEEMGELPNEYYHEPRSALAAEDQGLALVLRILTEASQFLSPNGLLVMDVGHSDLELVNRFPELPFTWLDLEQGGNGIFLLTREQLIEFYDEGEG